MPQSEPDIALVPPERLGPFRVTGVLGEGGSAVVYAIERDGEILALKVPRARELSDKEQERFLEEAKMLARVRHRAVVEVLDSGRLPDGQPFLLMRRVEGETLGDRIARAGALPLELSLSLFTELGSAVQALHDAGLLHRDLKPENLLLVDGGRGVKLLDFGIAKDIDAPASTTTQAGIARGTPATMAPERFFGAPANKSTDVYELAVILYVMLVGSLPWPEVTNPQARLNPLSPLEAGANVPDALSDVVMQALSTRPERRPDSIDKLVQLVLAASAAAVDKAPRVTAKTPMMSTGALVVGNRSDEAQVIESRREPRRASSGFVLYAAVGALIAAGIGTIAFFSLRSAPSPAETESGARPSVAAETRVAPAPPPPDESAVAEAPAPSEKAPAVARVRSGTAPTRASASAPAPSGSAAKPAPAKGKPKGAPCTRSSECASMVCAAETCQ